MPVPCTLGSLPFVQVVARAEALGAGRGLPAVIALYTSWIAAQHHAEPNLFAAWFNVGAELSQAGALAEAMGAYRHALRHKPDFYGAAVNLGLLLERQGQAEAALQVWTQAIQPDEARIALLNQRGRLLEQSGRLAEASGEPAPEPADPTGAARCPAALAASAPADVPMAGPGGNHSRSVRRAAAHSIRPAAALALTDDIAAQIATAAAWIARKPPPAPLAWRPGRLPRTHASASATSRRTSAATP